MSGLRIFGSSCGRSLKTILLLLSVILKARVNRWIYIIVAGLYIVVGIGTTVGETWAFYILGHVVGIVVLLVVIGTAVRWPKKEA